MRSILARIGWARLLVMAVFVVAGLLVARYCWTIPIASDAERALYDLRAHVTTPQVEQDPRIVLVTYTDETLEATGRRSPLDRGLLARALTHLDALQPKAIGIDILVDQPQPEDDQLRAALRAMKTPTYLAFGSAANNPESILPWQETFERKFQASVAGGNTRAASIRLEADSDNVVRSWPRRPKEEPKILSDSMAGNTGAFVGPEHGIAFRLPRTADRPVFASIPIDLFDSEMGAQALADAIRGRYVLIGGDITDIDRMDIPTTRLSGRQITGLEVHATLLAQRLDGRIGSAFSPGMLWALATIIVAAAAATGLSELGGWKAAALLLVQLGLVGAAPFGFEKLGYSTLSLPAFGWIIGWILAYSAAAAAARGVNAEQRRFAQGALGRYLPGDVARAILRDPEQLKLSGERRKLYTLFSDLEGFTALTDAIAPEVTASLLNDYLDRLSNVVLAHGGTIDKFVGDAVIAFWGAPIARESDGEMAARAAIAMVEAGNDFSAAAPSYVPRIGRTRVGVHHGDAIVGNFGGDDRIQYTALGDAMNVASRLEAANKATKTRALISAEAAEGLQGVPLRPMGRIRVRGREAPLFVYEPVPDGDAADIPELARMLADFDAGASGALAEIRAFAEARPADAGLANLVYRLEQSGPGGSFALE